MCSFPRTVHAFFFDNENKKRLRNNSVCVCEITTSRPTTFTHTDSCCVISWEIKKKFNTWKYLVKYIFIGTHKNANSHFDVSKQHAASCYALHTRCSRWRNSLSQIAELSKITNFSSVQQLIGEKERKRARAAQRVFESIPEENKLKTYTTNDRSTRKYYVSQFA